MKQYIELSQEFLAKPNAAIRKLYDLMNVLEKDGDKENKIVLVSVYELLKYYKKAFDLYMEIYEKNDI
jgi:hypothetical protein